MSEFGNSTPVVPRRAVKKPFRGLVTSINKLTYDIRQFRIELIDPPTIAFLPGQNIRLSCPPYGNNPAGVGRNYSISSLPSDERAIELIVRHVPSGVCTTWLFDILQEGDEVTFTGPYGRFGLSQSQRPMVWVAGGSGLGVFWSMVRHMEQSGIARPVTLFFGAVGREDLYLTSELADMQARLPWFRFVPALSGTATDDAWPGERGLITDVVERQIRDGADLEAYLCGSAGMIDRATAILAAKGVSEASIFQDKFYLDDTMAASRSPV